MSDLDFIADVIYGLKIEYGEPIVISHSTNTTNLVTGAINQTITQFNINLAIPMPAQLRQLFFERVGIKKEGYLEPGTQDFLIDKADLGTRTIFKNDAIVHNGINKQVIKIDDYQYGLVVTTKIV